MKKRFFVLLISTFVVTSLSSCSNSKDTRLDNFNYDSMISYLNGDNYVISYTIGDNSYKLSKDNEKIVVEDNSNVETYYYSGSEEYYYFDSQGKRFDAKEDVSMAFDYLIENFAFEYKKYIKTDDMIFVKEEKGTDSKNVYQYKVLYSTTNNQESGYYYTIDVKTGFLLEKEAYGPNKDLLLGQGNIKLIEIRGI